MRKILIILAMMLCCIVAKGQEKYSNREMLFWMTDNTYNHELLLTDFKTERCKYKFYTFNYDFDYTYKIKVSKFATKDTTINNDTIEITFINTKQNDIDYIFESISYKLKYSIQNNRYDTIYTGYGCY